MSEKKLTCFVIMPFSQSSDKHTEEYWTNHFTNFLKPEIEKIPALEAKRSDELRGDILKEVINDLYDSFIIVADLTDHNPNVFWELGIRQSFKQKTITIAQKGTPLPFDVSTKHTLFYESHNDGQFSKAFNQALTDCLINPEKSDSIVLETLSDRTRDMSSKNELKDTINHHYIEITGFFDELFSGKLRGGVIKLYYILNYVSDNSKELGKYFGFHREKKDQHHVQTFWFLKNKYRIDFQTNIHCIIIYPESGPPKNISMSYPDEARNLYGQFKTELKNHIKENFDIQI